MTAVLAEAYKEFHEHNRVYILVAWTDTSATFYISMHVLKLTCMRVKTMLDSRVHVSELHSEPHLSCKSSAYCPVHKLGSGLLLYVGV